MESHTRYLHNFRNINVGREMEQNCTAASPEIWIAITFKLLVIFTNSCLEQ